MLDKIKIDFPLTHGDVSLHLLSFESKERLTYAASDPRIWEFAYEPLWEAKIFEEKWFEKALRQLSQEKRYPFFICKNEDIVGSVSLYNIDEDNKTLYVGYTWYSPNYWGTSLNPTVKYMLLSYVFEQLQFHRVAFNVDIHNIRSQKAMKKIGATQEGILRKHMIRPDGSHRDSVLLTIIDEDWPTVKKDLLKKIKTV